MALYGVAERLKHLYHTHLSVFGNKLPSKSLQLTIDEYLEDNPVDETEDECVKKITDAGHW